MPQRQLSEDEIVQVQKDLMFILDDGERFLAMPGYDRKIVIAAVETFNSYRSFTPVQAEFVSFIRAKLEGKAHQIDLGEFKP